MAGYIAQRTASLGDFFEDVQRTIVDRSPPHLWSHILRVALEYAAEAANEALVQRLLHAGANAGGAILPPRRTLVNAAVDGGSAWVMSTLLREGANADINTPACVGGPTPLHRAVLEGKVRVAEVLIMAGAMVNTCSNDDSPLHCSIRRGYRRITYALLLAGALSTTFLAGTYPIHLAAGLGQTEVVQYLIDKGSSVDCPDAKWESPLHCAIHGGHISVMRVLLAAGSDTAAALAPDRFCALHLAAELNNAQAVKVLVGAGVDVDERSTGGRTALYQATRVGALDAMLCLLGLGAGVNATDHNGVTPLHRACFLGAPDAVDMLLRWGADETLFDHQGEPPAAWILTTDDAEKRLSKMLARAPQDRAWRRRGLLVMCRARLARLHPPPRRSRRIRMEREKGNTVGWTARWTSAPAARSSASDEEHGSGEFSWLVEPANGDVFRLVVGFM